jgi:hypothetical protein
MDGSGGGAVGVKTKPPGEDGSDAFMTSQYEPVLEGDEKENEKEEEGDDGTIAFVGAQYSNEQETSPIPVPVSVPVVAPVPELSAKQTKAAQKKQAALDEYNQIQAEKKRKLHEDEVNHKTFLDEIETRRRANVLINKAKRKKHQIFASQEYGLRKRLVAG